MQSRRDAALAWLDANGAAALADSAGLRPSQISETLRLSGGAALHRVRTHDLPTVMKLLGDVLCTKVSEDVCDLDERHPDDFGDAWVASLGDELVGLFLIEPDAYQENLPFDLSYVRLSWLDAAVRGVGLGRHAYQALADHYDTLASDPDGTSPAAARVWERLGALRVPATYDAAVDHVWVLHPGVHPLAAPKSVVPIRSLERAKKSGDPASWVNHMRYARWTDDDGNMWLSETKTGNEVDDIVSRHSYRDRWTSVDKIDWKRLV